MKNEYRILKLYGVEVGDLLIFPEMIWIVKIIQLQLKAFYIYSIDWGHISIV